MDTHLVTIPDTFRDSFETIAEWILSDLQNREANMRAWDDTIVYRMPAGYYGSQVRVSTYSAVALKVVPDFSTPRVAGVWFKKWDLIDPDDDIYALVLAAMVRDYADAKAHS